MRRITWLLLVLLATVASGCDVETMTEATREPASRTTPGPTPATSGSVERAEVVRVVDGDTLIVEIDGREERLRYIGVDTPESVQPNTPVECFGREASAENARLVEGREVELERDVSNRDRYDRLLRYVYVVEEGERIFVNEALVAGGFAHSSSFPPDVKHQDRFRAAQREARDEGRGLWGECAP
ncbi:MAG TPA: thermonuclease family protein [Thermomicrobiales bacterium]|nr:thermonuclease family protein [Thermomicrobiales bacterium]